MVIYWLAAGMGSRDALEVGQRIGLVVLDVEIAIQAGHLEHLVDRRPDVRELQQPLARLDLPLQDDQLPQCGTGKELHIGEVQKELLAALQLNELEEFLAKLLDIDVFRDSLVSEPHDGDVADLVAVQPSILGHRDNLHNTLLWGGLRLETLARIPRMEPLTYTQTLTNLRPTWVGVKARQAFWKGFP